MSRVVMYRVRTMNGSFSSPDRGYCVGAIVFTFDNGHFHPPTAKDFELNHEIHAC